MKTAYDGLKVGVYGRDELNRLNQSDSARFKAFVERFTDINHVRQVVLFKKTASFVVFCTDTNGSRYLIDGKIAVVTFKVKYGLKDIT